MKRLTILALIFGFVLAAPISQAAVKYVLQEVAQSDDSDNTDSNTRGVLIGKPVTALVTPIQLTFGANKCGAFWNSSTVTWETNANFPTGVNMDAHKAVMLDTTNTKGAFFPPHIYAPPGSNNGDRYDSWVVQGDDQPDDTCFETLEGESVYFIRYQVNDN